MFHEYYSLLYPSSINRALLFNVINVRSIASKLTVDIQVPSRIRSVVISKNFSKASECLFWSCGLCHRSGWQIFAFFSFSFRWFLWFHWRIWDLLTCSACSVCWPWRFRHLPESNEANKRVFVRKEEWIWYHEPRGSPLDRWAGVLHGRSLHYGSLAGKSFSWSGYIWVFWSRLSFRLGPDWHWIWDLDFPDPYFYNLVATSTFK